MGEVISLDQRRRERDRVQAPASAADLPAVSTFYFDLGSPSTYFAAERAERMFPRLAWRPALAPPSASPPSLDGDPRAAGARAAELRMPLVWPDSRPVAGRAAMRVAAFAAERAQASAFVLAASRLAYCGGFDLDDLEILAEAISAAALPFDAGLAAAEDAAHDAAMLETGSRLFAMGADRLPVLTVGRRLFAGEERLTEAAAAMREPCGERRRAPRNGSVG